MLVALNAGFVCDPTLGAIDNEYSDCNTTVLRYWI